MCENILCFYFNEKYKYFESCHGNYKLKIWKRIPWGKLEIFVNLTLDKDHWLKNIMKVNTFNWTNWTVDVCIVSLINLLGFFFVLFLFLFFKCNFALDNLVRYWNFFFFKWTFEGNKKLTTDKHLKQIQSKLIL